MPHIPSLSLTSCIGALLGLLESLVAPPAAVFGFPSVACLTSVFGPTASPVFGASAWIEGTASTLLACTEEKGLCLAMRKGCRCRRSTGVDSDSALELRVTAPDRLPARQAEQTRRLMTPTTCQDNKGRGKLGRSSPNDSSRLCFMAPVDLAISRGSNVSQRHGGPKATADHRLAYILQDIYRTTNPPSQETTTLDAHPLSPQTLEE